MPVLGGDTRGPTTAVGSPAGGRERVPPRALVLIHGFPFDRTLWALVIDALAESRPVIAVDLRGRGKSDSWGGSGSWTIADHAADVAATIDSLGGGAADVAGLSMGGYVLFALLRAHPAKVKSAILISTKATADDLAGRQGRDSMAAHARHEGTLALFDLLAPKVLAKGASDDARARLRAMFQRTPAGTAAADALAMRDRPDSTPDLPRIQIPVCVIHGTEDALMPIAGAESMAAAIPGARFVAIEGAGHVPALEKPEATAAAMLGFLTGG